MNTVAWFSNNAESAHDVIAELGDAGCVLVRSIDQHALELVFDVIATRRHHRDSDDRGWTNITPRSSQRKAGYAGFSREPLALHTDCSSWTTPPRLLATLCVCAPHLGGEALLADMHQVLRLLDPNDRELLRTTPIRFGSERFIAFVVSGGAGELAIRYRDDALVDPTSLGSAWDRLRDAIDSCTQVVPMSPGDGYIIDNYRWLHGRRGFDGNRSVLRLLGDFRVAENLKAAA